MLDTDLHDELKALAAVMPGGSVSGFINDGMRAGLPYFARIRDALAATDNERALATINEMIGSAITSIHTVQAKRAEKEGKG
jgi:hypothetical protein